MISRDLSLVIATMHRAGPLAEVFACLEKQTLRPHTVIVVDASTDDLTAKLVAAWQTRLPLQLVRANQASAARQRNQGAALVGTRLIGFMDDDVVLAPDTLEKLAAPFEDEGVGGIAGRIVGLEHPVPRGLLWLYYRIQAGYAHAHYGAHVIGPAINLLPAFGVETRPLIPSQWLNSTLVLYRRDLFDREHFPDFDGYSFLEDVHLSYRIGRTHRLYFRGDAPYVHNSAPSSAKADRQALARMCVRHQRIVARDLLGLRGLTLHWKLFLHRLFQTAAVLRQSKPDRWRTALGFWQS